MATTVADCHGVPGLTAAGASVALVALFEPGVAAVVVAVLFPEAGFVVVEHPQPGDELRALPEVEVRHDEPRRSAVLTREWLPVDLPRDPRFPPGDVGQRQIGRVAGV